MESPLWLDDRDALTLHDRLLVLHGGATGLRDEGLLASALARLQQYCNYTKRQLALATGTMDVATCASILKNQLQAARKMDRHGIVTGQSLPDCLPKEQSRLAAAAWRWTKIIKATVPRAIFAAFIISVSNAYSIPTPQSRLAHVVEHE